MPPPALVLHADWSMRPAKRWQSTALLQANGRYRLLPTARSGDLWRSLKGHGGRVLLGFDFPLGVPAAYAVKAGIDDFADALQHFGSGRLVAFYEVAERPEEISLVRPFYPQRPGGRRRQQLLDALGLGTWRDLLRRCDLPSPTRPAACALFWTLGGSQVGKAAIAGWRDLLAPALRDGVDVGLWPFQGRLEELLARHRFTVAETYPGEVYSQLGLSPALRRDGGKRSRCARGAAAASLLAAARQLDVDVEPAARTEIEAGFGAGADGEDRFDAVVGLLGMVGVVRGRRGSGEPDDPVVRRIEGWILGQTA
jgi:hypothetical protein